MKEAIITATKLDGLLMTTIKGEDAARYEYFGLPLPTFICHMRTWGHAEDHCGDYYRMWEPEKNCIYVTREALRLKRM